MKRLAKLSALLCMFAGGCASVPFDQPKVVSTAFVEHSATKLGRLASSMLDQPGRQAGESGFLLLGDGIEALAARLELIRAAEARLDIQYYFILESLAARLFLGELLAAADRGVQIRLLVDDWSTSGYEDWMVAMETHPKIEIRFFNPFSRRTPRVFDFFSQLDRVEHRMHNKSFTADSSFTIVGGRNIGDEYFSARRDLDFIDLDLLGIGPVAFEVANAFDIYWNSYPAVPVSSLLESPESSPLLTEIRDNHQKVLAEVEQTEYGRALEAARNGRLDLREDRLDWAPFSVIQDSPDKAVSGVDHQDVEFLATKLVESMDAAQSEFMLISPYFVPLDVGVERLSQLEQRGVRVIIVTNSLAATDVSAVHAGYKKFRKDLLAAGVELWETRADLRVAVGHSQTSLHAKAFVIDRRHLYVGSFNWDARSTVYNTEMGIVVDSTDLAGRTARGVESILPDLGYQVRLDQRGRLEWVEFVDGRETLAGKEPQAGFWRRLGVSLLGLLPIAGQL